MEGKEALSLDWLFLAIRYSYFAYYVTRLSRYEADHVAGVNDKASTFLNRGNTGLSKYPDLKSIVRVVVARRRARNRKIENREEGERRRKLNTSKLRKMPTTKESLSFLLAPFVAQTRVSSEPSLASNHRPPRTQA